MSSAAEAAAIGGVIAAAAALPSLSRSPRSSSRPDLLSPGGNPTGNGASWFLSNVWDSWKVRPAAGSALLGLAGHAFAGNMHASMINARC